tara:strand:+ start:10794 stop:11036 length:243 start_codon:yes stop_codon:yes gene_type:complete
MDIEQMLIEAENGKRGSNFVESQITKDAMPFWIALKDRVTKDGIHLKPYVVHRLLRENFDIKISESAIRKYLIELEKGNA